MESRLSSFYNRIRRTFRRRMAGVPSKSQQQETGSTRGNPSDQIMITPTILIKEEIEVKRERTKARAKELLELMLEMEERDQLKGRSPRPGRRALITRFGMLRILLGVVAELGEIPRVDFLNLEQEGMLTMIEIKNLKDIIPMARLMLESTVR
ncbi:C protein [Gerbil paramyxovirus]|uniref:C protein n=1 Tax=Gerbil paramyxovirus TaxID=2942127 RepID=A0A977NVX4_9MONO|nr:C protein [Gerbil paramyxovirus]